MKPKLWLLFFLLLCNFIAYSQTQKSTNNFTLKGTTTDPKTRIVWLTYSVENEKRVKQKAYVKNGAFHFEGFIESPLYAELYFNSEPLANHDWGINEIFLSPGSMTIALTGQDTQSATITGSAMQDEWVKLRVQKQGIEKAKHDLDSEANKLGAAGNTPKNHAAMIKLGNKYDKYNAQEKQIDLSFIATHPSSYLSPYLSAYYFDYEEKLSLDSAAMFYNRFTPQVKNSFAGKSLLNNISKHKSSTTGAIAPLFIKNDINKKQIDLKSFRDKNYVLLYFWSSWSTYHSNEVKHLNELYNIYHPKGLEFISLSYDLTKKELEKAILENGMNKWHNILMAYDTSPAAKYNVDGMPPTILIFIDKKGKIIGRYIGKHAAWEKKTDNEGEIHDLDKKLAEILGK